MSYYSNRGFTTGLMEGFNFVEGIVNLRRQTQLQEEALKQRERDNARADEQFAMQKDSYARGIRAENEQHRATSRATLFENVGQRLARRHQEVMLGKGPPLTEAEKRQSELIGRQSPSLAAALDQQVKLDLINKTNAEERARRDAEERDYAARFARLAGPDEPPPGVAQQPAEDPNFLAVQPNPADSRVPGATNDATRVVSVLEKERFAPDYKPFSITDPSTYAPAAGRAVKGLGGLLAPNPYAGNPSLVANGPPITPARTAGNMEVPGDFKTRAELAGMGSAVDRQHVIDKQTAFFADGANMAPATVQRALDQKVEGRYRAFVNADDPAGADMRRQAAADPAHFASTYYKDRGSLSRAARIAADREAVPVVQQAATQAAAVMASSQRGTPEFLAAKKTLDNSIAVLHVADKDFDIGQAAGLRAGAIPVGNPEIAEKVLSAAAEQPVSPNSPSHAQARATNTAVNRLVDNTATRPHSKAREEDILTVTKGMRLGFLPNDALTNYLSTGQVSRPDIFTHLENGVLTRVDKATGATSVISIDGGAAAQAAKAKDMWSPGVIAAIDQIAEANAGGDKERVAVERQKAYLSLANNKAALADAGFTPEQMVHKGPADVFAMTTRALQYAQTRTAYENAFFRFLRPKWENAPNNRFDNFDPTAVEYDVGVPQPQTTGGRLDAAAVQRARQMLAASPDARNRQLAKAPDAELAAYISKQTGAQWHGD